MIFTIYLITNKLNGKVYVGQTRQKLYARWACHKRDAKYGSELCICRAIRKYTPEAFTIQEIATAETQEWCDYLERVWILLYDSRNRKKGYNVRAGGIHSPGISPEGRIKLQKANSGKSHSEESKRRMSEGIKKAWVEGRIKGIPHTEEAKKKMKASHQGVKHNWYRQDICSEELVFLWNNDVPTKNIADHFKISRAMLYERIKSSGLPYKPFGRQPLSEAQIKEILLLVENKVTQREIGRRIGCDQSTISHLLKRLKEASL